MAATQSSLLRSSSQTAESNPTAAHSHYIAGREIQSVLVPENKFWHFDKRTSDNNDATNAEKSTASLHDALSNADKIKVEKQRQKLEEIRTEAHSSIPIAIILNVLSMAQVRHRFPTSFSENGTLKSNPKAHGPKVLVFLLNSSQSLCGNTFDTKTQPDLVAILSDYETADKYLKKLENWRSSKPPKLGSLRPAFAVVVAVIELKKPHQKVGNHHKGLAQLSNYLDTNKRCRPDLDVIYGLYGCKTGFAIYQLNPCQLTQLRCDGIDSKTQLLPWKHKMALSILQKFISAICAISTCDHPLSLEPNTLQVWKFNPNSVLSSQKGKETSKVLRMVPFYATHAPGRMTWVAASFEDGNQSIHRIVKLYWVDEATRWNEKELYQRAHGKSEGWLGGLARLDNYWDLKRKLQSVSPNEGEDWSPLRRKLVGLRLGSSGKPLNQLETDIDVLKCMYDLLETLQQINKNGVLHQDISWGNVFCHPEHFIDPDENGTTSGCIGDIMGEEKPRFRVLVTDLDQGASIASSSVISEAPTSDQALEESKEKASRRRRMGTPMFAAAAIADPEWEYPPSLSASRLALSALHASMSPLLQSLAKEDYDFYTNLLEEVKDKRDDYDVTLYRRRASQTTSSEHRPCHDAESVSWLTSFILARALPLDQTSNDLNTDEAGVYNRFCTAMFSHAIGKSHQLRMEWGHNTAAQRDLWRRTLHPRLRHHANLLDSMALYLSIDWTVIRPDIPDNHAYRVLKLFLLDEILKSEGTQRIVKLQTQWPRPAYDLRTTREGNARINSSPIVSRTSSATGSDNSHGKRKAQGDGSSRPSKKVKSSHSPVIAGAVPSSEANYDTDKGVEDSETGLTKEEVADEEVATSKKEEFFFAEWEKANRIQSERMIANRWYSFQYIEPHS